MSIRLYFGGILLFCASKKRLLDDVCMQLCAKICIILSLFRCLSLRARSRVAGLGICGIRVAVGHSSVAALKEKVSLTD